MSLDFKTAWLHKEPKISIWTSNMPWSKSRKDSVGLGIRGPEVQYSEGGNNFVIESIFKLFMIHEPLISSDSLKRR